MKKIDYPDEFESIWMMKPEREGCNSKSKAHRAWFARLREGYVSDDLEQGLHRYINYCRHKDIINTPFVKQLSTFFGSGEFFLEAWEIKSKSTRDSSLVNDVLDRSWAYD